MKYLSEALIICLLAATVTFIYAMYQVATEAINSGIISEFAIGYVFGFISPIIVGLWVASKLFRPKIPNSGLNTDMDKFAEQINNIF